MLREAARSTASWSVRNMGTVGGNLFTPPPGGDVAVALLALDATVTLAGPEGERILPLADFFTGFMTNALAADELLVEIGVPDPTDPTAYLKFGRKHANTPAVVTVAARVAWDGDRVADARIALGAVGPHPDPRPAGRAAPGRDGPRGRTRSPRRPPRRPDESEPFTDAIATEWYRRRMTGLFVGRALEQLARGRRGGGR